MIIHGRVQGVGFRYATHGEATRLGVTGWVQNLPESQVEVWAEGDENQVELLFQWCHRGPLFAKVTQVEIRAKHRLEALEFSNFEIRR